MRLEIDDFGCYIAVTRRRAGQRLAGSQQGQKPVQGFGQTLKRADSFSIDAEEAIAQYGALCYRRDRKGRTEVLLITSRDTGRWVIPKGWPVKGLSGGESARREAFEEAGVEGELIEHCLGLYAYAKVLGPGRELPCIVAVYPIRVEKMRKDFPEKGQRRLEWFRPAKAAGLVDEPELGEILAGFDPQRLAEDTLGGG